MKHRNRKILGRSVATWRVAAVEAIAGAHQLAEQGEAFFERCLKNKYLRVWKCFMEPRRAAHTAALQVAVQWREKKLRALVFHLWLASAKRIAIRRAKTMEVILFILPLGMENSTPQKMRTEKALKFFRRRALLKSWEAFIALNQGLADRRRHLKVRRDFTAFNFST